MLKMITIDQTTIQSITFCFKIIKENTNPMNPKSIENDDIVLDLLRYGAQGLEVFHPIHSLKETEKYKQIAEENKKYMTGGSDWHGKNNGAEVTHFAMTGLEDENYEILKIRGCQL